MTLVSDQGVWASVDHRLTAFPSGKVLTDDSVKHVVLSCPDGFAVVSYTGLGRVGRIDVSTWIREVLRGQPRTVDDSLIDLRVQATKRLAVPAFNSKVPHTFMAGVFLQGSIWAVEIKNFRRATTLVPQTLLLEFKTSATQFSGVPLLMLGGAGENAISTKDRELMVGALSKRPRRPEDFMRLLGDVNQRAAQSRAPGASTVSPTSTVVFAPPINSDVKVRHYGPDSDTPLEPSSFSYIFNGVDLGEATKPAFERSHALFEGLITPEQFAQSPMDAWKNMDLGPKGRR